MILFVTDDCPKCELVKRKMAEVPREMRPEVRVLNVHSVDGMAEAAYYGVTLMTAPVLIVDEPRIITDLNDIVEQVV